MPVDTVKRNKRQNGFIKTKYDRFTLILPKGKKEKYQAIAGEKGLSLSAYIHKLIEADINKTPAD